MYIHICVQLCICVCKLYMCIPYLNLILHNHMLKLDSIFQFRGCKKYASETKNYKTIKEVNTFLKRLKFPC